MSRARRIMRASSVSGLAMTCLRRLAFRLRARPVAAFLPTLLALGLAACGSAPAPLPPPLPTLAAAPADWSVYVGQRVQVTVPLTLIDTGGEGVLPTAIPQDSTAKVAAPTEATEAATPAPSISMPAKKSSTMVSGVFIKGAKATWPGLDSEGLPTAFTVTGENGTLGKIRINRNVPEATEQGTILATQAITSGGGPNVMIDQSITVDGNGTKYEVGYVSFGIGGNWAVADASATNVDFERMSNGQYLMTVTISLLSTPTSDFAIPVGDRGFDLVGAPKTITSRLLLNASKTQILAQAVLVPRA